WPVAPGGSIARPGRSKWGVSCGAVGCRGPGCERTRRLPSRSRPAHPALLRRESTTMRQNGAHPPSTTTTPKPPPRPKAARARTNGSGTGQYDLPTDRVDERKLLEVLTALRKGNFAPRLPVKWTGIAGKVADTVNEVMETNLRMAKEIERLARVVGK